MKQTAIIQRDTTSQIHTS